MKLTRHSIPFPNPFSNLCPLIHKMVQVKIVQMSEKKRATLEVIATGFRKIDLYR